MTFVRSKQIPPRTGDWYDYEVKTIHENGHVRQKMVRYIGKSSTNHNPVLIGNSGIDGCHADSTVPNSRLQLKVVCKHCQGQHTRKYGIDNGTQYYYCDDCQRKFAR